MTDEEFMRVVLLSYESKGDPRVFTGWDADRCRQLMPAFYAAWRDAQIANDVLKRVARSYDV